MNAEQRPRRVLIVLPQRVHLMDMAGAAQVFSSANDLVSQAYEVMFVGAEAGAPSHQGLAPAPPTSWPVLERRDLVIVSGWKTQLQPEGLTPALSENVSRHWHDGGHVASICAGSLALAQAGILTGQTATTHHDLIAQLRRHSQVDVVEDVLFTCGPRLHTSAGIASGIDLCLLLVAHDHGPAVAARIARTLVVPAWRPGNTSQDLVTLTHRNHMDHLTHQAQDILDDTSHKPPALAELGRRVGVSGRTLARHFVDAAGMTPQAYASAVRLEHATRLHEQGWSWESAAHAVGYADARSLRERG